MYSKFKELNPMTFQLLYSFTVSCKEFDILVYIIVEHTLVFNKKSNERNFLLMLREPTELMKDSVKCLNVVSHIQMQIYFFSIQRNLINI